MRLARFAGYAKLVVTASVQCRYPSQTSKGMMMRQPRQFSEYGKAGCCPDDWNHTPNMTGDFEFDGSIQHCKNRDMRGKLEDHLAGSAAAYTINTAYGRTPR